jgi:hypothetical protein
MDWIASALACYPVQHLGVHKDDMLQEASFNAALNNKNALWSIGF